MDGDTTYLIFDYPYLNVVFQCYSLIFGITCDNRLMLQRPGFNKEMMQSYLLEK